MVRPTALQRVDNMFFNQVLRLEQRESVKGGQGGRKCVPLVNCSGEIAIFKSFSGGIYHLELVSESWSWSIGQYYIVRDGNSYG